MNEHCSAGKRGGKAGLGVGGVGRGGAVSGRAVHDPHCAQITLVACEGEMRETRVWKMENSLGSFFHIAGEI